MGKSPNSLFSITQIPPSFKAQVLAPLHRLCQLWHIFSPVVPLLSVWDLITFIHSVYAEMYSWVPTMGSILTEINRTPFIPLRSSVYISAVQNDIMRVTNIILNFQVHAFKQVKKDEINSNIFYLTQNRKVFLASTCNNLKIMNYIFYIIHYTKTLWCVIFTLPALSQIGPHFKCSTFTCC